MTLAKREGGENRMVNEKTYWNGEEHPAAKVKVIVGKAEKATYWHAGLEGTVRNAVRVGELGGKGYHAPFYLDNEDGDGWAKVTLGQGGPGFSHSSLVIEKEVDL